MGIFSAPPGLLIMFVGELDHTSKENPMLKALTFVQAYFNSLRSEEAGNAAEYGLIIALIAVVIIGGLTALGLALAGVFNKVSGSI